FEHGEYASRGSVFDLFPLGSEHPIRIDLFDDVVDSLRVFDPETQRTLEKTSSVHILPAHEYPLDEQSIERFRDGWNDSFDVGQWTNPIYEDISDGRAVEGAECYLPLFFEKTSSLLDYIPADSVVFLDQEVEDAADSFLQEVEARYEANQVSLARPLLPPRRLYFHLDELRHQWKTHPRIQLVNHNADLRHTISLNGKELPNVSLEPRRSDPVRKIRDFVGNVGVPVLLTAESNGRLQHMREVLGRGRIFGYEVDSYTEFLEKAYRLATTVSPISRGFWSPEAVVLTETELLGDRSVSDRVRAQRKRVDPETVVRNLTELHPGAPVVHMDHGVGRYVGLETLKIRAQLMDFVTLEYADGDKLYVPVSSLDLISRYTGADEENAPLHKLGTDAWAKAKTRAAQRIFDVAAELLNIYARREASSSVKLPEINDDYQLFCDQCDFDLTEDQSLATDAILGDLSRIRATDRLVCGDVGFGKTEVAMRAAFHAVQSGYQAVVLVPTTILAQQHFETFRDRFANWPVIIDLMSRFRSTKELEEVSQKLEEGKIDILIGTHKLLHASLDFSQLGLLIVDEEHRFGVRDKERVKNLRATTNTISLTATPIPRTLNMSMGGLRDLSIIATPPAKRLSVKTFIVPYDRIVVRDAIQRELARGGQVFYLHNDVRTMHDIYEGLHALVPEARLGIGHGQMRKTELERVMSDFYHRRCNVLICSTIIESGIDIPNANTIVIERADKFGLAQLHQLRGRVGRSTRQAYAYLLTPEESVMTVDARKRLDAIESAGELGSGFTLAVHDLEIRGAGELLGKEQSGQLETIGFTLYMQLLNRAVNTLKSGVVPNFEEPIPMVHEINLNVSALIPDTYLPDIHGRLVTYKRIAAADDCDELNDLKIELIDRCGPLPDLATNLFEISRIKLKAKEAGISRIEVNSEGGRVEFLEKNQIDPAALVRLLQSQSNAFQMSGQTTLRVLKAPVETQERFEFVLNLIDVLKDETRLKAYA
ncbi:MAG: transcription-repair coupling factor, partial [Gammaproteobacteria bacterium]|nr:transcription-repair coupling factor [Gammaproteobacteria bacterium]